MCDIQGLLCPCPRCSFSIHIHIPLSQWLLASCLPKKIFLQHCFMYVLSRILSDPSELSVNCSADTEQLMAWKQKKKSWRPALLAYYISLLPFCLIIFLHLSFILFVIQRRLVEVSGSVLTVITKLIILAKLKTNC